MKKVVFCTTILTSIILMSGCASNQTTASWYQQGKTPQQQAKDMADCRLMAEQHSNPLAMVNAGFFIHDSMHKNSMFNDCMISKGYTLVEAKKEAATPPKK